MAPLLQDTFLDLENKTLNLNPFKTFQGEGI